MSHALSTSSSENAGERPSARRSLARWVPVVLWATCISWFSTDAFSARSTNSYIDPVLRYFFGELSAEGFRFAHTIIRKSAHFLEYAVLGMLVCRATAVPGARPSAGAIVRTIVACGLYAALDELHQTFVPNRTGAPTDVAIDTIGAAVGTSLLTWRRARRRA